VISPLTQPAAAGWSGRRATVQASARCIEYPALDYWRSSVRSKLDVAQLSTSTLHERDGYHIPGDN
jgi:hypothetical protein